jgi:hypothetical protein
MRVKRISHIPQRSLERNDIPSMAKAFVKATVGRLPTRRPKLRRRERALLTRTASREEVPC